MNDAFYDTLAVSRWLDEGNPNDDRGNTQTEEGGVSSLNAKPVAAAPETVYGTLAEHQVSAPWRHRDLATELHRWAVIFNSEFNLHVSEIALCIDWLSRFRLGHFRPGHNGFGLKGEIALNERYLMHREPWQVLGTVLHEMLHAWQEEHGKPGKPPYHNKQFREMALQFGLVIDERGVTSYLSKSRFKDLLARHGVHLPAQPMPAQRILGNSKLKKWSCRCPVNVRVAVADFEARCLKCGSLFVRR